jgi:hydroxymethylglutaryl-CoA synthase
LTGPYSNQAYQARIREALIDYRRRSGKEAGTLLEDFSFLIFHLPYAFQARRMFSEIYMEELRANGSWGEFVMRNRLSVPCADDYDNREEYITKCAEFLRMVTKTDDYRQFIQERIAPGEWASSRVGNLYAGSVFLSLMSSLEAALDLDRNIAGESFCFFAYGSGSKSKVFAAEVQPAWREVVEKFGLRDRLDQREAVDYATYEALHRGNLTKNVATHDEGGFFLAHVHEDRDETEGARHYGYAASGVFA